MLCENFQDYFFFHKNFQNYFQIYQITYNYIFQKFFSVFHEIYKKKNRPDNIGIFPFLFFFLSVYV